MQPFLPGAGAQGRCDAIYPHPSLRGIGAQRRDEAIHSIQIGTGDSIVLDAG